MTDFADIAPTPRQSLRGEASPMLQTHCDRARDPKDPKNAEGLQRDRHRHLQKQPTIAPTPNP